MHGLTVDSAGTILAGTHSGLVALAPSGTTTEVGTSDDDLMGLAGVPGSDVLVASGHPGPSNPGPNPLGLRRSDDGGRTWTDRSLVGEVDFHALATDGTVVVGFDGTRDGLQAVKDGDLAADVLQFPDAMGIIGVDLMVRHLNGETIPDHVDSGSGLATPENIDQYLTS